MPILTAEERIGTLLAGRYRLESILGSGGTSVVYRASHAWTGRTLALKLLKPEHARDRGLVMRFLREARSASTLVHPNVVAILDMGNDPDGDVYLAMELVIGESLGALLDREGVLSPARGVELLRPIMEAVGCAHSRGIVHRDIKPDNVMVGHRGDGIMRSILLDFGMAKMTEAAWGHATQSGLIVGTPFYMSPEQAEGAPDVGPASDVWSLGVLWYRCLSGALPFFGAAPTSLLLAIVRGDHVPLHERAPGVPAALASVIERALQVDRRDRYADVREMLEALERAQRGGAVDPLGTRAPEPVGAAAPSPTVPLAEDAPEAAATISVSPRPRAIALAASAIAALTLAAIAIAAIALGGPPPIEEDGTPVPIAAAEPSRPAAPVVPAPVARPAPAPPIAEPSAIAPLRVSRSTALARPVEIPVEIPSPPAHAGGPDHRRRRGLARGFVGETREDERRSTGLATEW